MRSGAKVVLAVVAALVFLTGVFLVGVGSGYVLAGARPLRAQPATPDAVGPASDSGTPTPQALPANPTIPAADTATAKPAPSPSPARTPSLAPSPYPTPTPAFEESDDVDGTDEDPFQVLREVWDLVQVEFYGDLPDRQALNYAAIRGLLGALDDENTAFIEPRSAAVIDEDASGEFEGIGAYVGVDDEGKLEIISPFEGGPAAKAGLIAGDRVLAVDGTPLEGKSLYDAITLIRGPAGSQVILLIERRGAPTPVEAIVTRARIEVPTTTVRMTDEGIGYIRLHSFNAAASRQMEEGLEELLAQEPAALVLDIRQNPGGWLDQAIAVADLFLADGVILVERWSDGSEQVFEAGAGDMAEHVPLAILVDGGSASASEIVAGALQDSGRATLVGEPTYGKGSVQRPHTLSDGSELRVTIAVWFTPGGRAIHGRGLVPDIEVTWPEPTGDEPLTDPQLERAIQYLLTGE